MDDRRVDTRHQASAHRDHWRDADVEDAADGRLTRVACPVCGTDALYTAVGVHARPWHRVHWYLDARGRVLARWTDGDGDLHEVAARAPEVFCQGCHTRVNGPEVWRAEDPVAPWPRVFFRGA